jgi:hypothetical protein
MYHDRTAWRYALFVGKKYGSKGYPQGNAAHTSARRSRLISENKNHSIVERDLQLF